MTGCNNTSLSLPTGPTYNVNSSGNYPLLSNHKTPFLYSNSPLRPFNINSGQPENRFGTPLDDPGLYKLLEDFEVECKIKEIAERKKKLFQKFSSAIVVYQNKNMQYQQVIFLKPGSVWVLQDYERSSTTFGLKVFYLFSDNRNYLKPLVS